MNKLKRNIELKDLILLIIILLLTIISLIMYLRISFVNNQYKEDTSRVLNVISEKEKTGNNENVSIPQTEEEIKKYLSTLGERDRMEYYCGKYIKHLKHKEYEQAYNMLYTEFKQNYFPTIEKYEEYVKDFYPDYFGLQYDDITRQGNIYVLRLKIIDTMDSETEEENIQRIVIRENDYNDFELSFQVK